MTNHFNRQIILLKEKVVNNHRVNGSQSEMLHTRNIDDILNELSSKVFKVGK